MTSVAQPGFSGNIRRAILLHLIAIQQQRKLSDSWSQCSWCCRETTTQKFLDSISSFSQIWACTFCLQREIRPQPDTSQFSSWPQLWACGLRPQRKPRTSHLCGHSGSPENKLIFQKTPRLINVQKKFLDFVNNSWENSLTTVSIYYLFWSCQSYHMILVSRWSLNFSFFWAL